MSVRARDENSRQSTRGRRKGELKRWQPCAFLCTSAQRTQIEDRGAASQLWEQASVTRNDLRGAEMRFVSITKEASMRAEAVALSFLGVALSADYFCEGAEMGCWAWARVGRVAAKPSFS